MSKTDKFLLRLPERLKADVYKRANASNLSVNQMIIRMLNNSLYENSLSFEFRHVKKGEKFIFVDDKSQTIYKVLNKNKNGIFCKILGIKNTPYWIDQKYFNRLIKIL